MTVPPQDAKTLGRSPHFSTIRDGNRIAIPDDYLPPDYQSPSFRVKVEPSRAATEGSFQPKDGGSESAPHCVQTRRICASAPTKVADGSHRFRITIPLKSFY